jgi:hypothetical protein
MSTLNGSSRIRVKANNFSVTSPLTGSGTQAEPLRLIDADEDGKVLVWQNGAWVIGDGGSGTPDGGTAISELEASLTSDIATAKTEAIDSANLYTDESTQYFKYQKFVVYETNTAIFADGSRGREDALLRQGWFYKNDGSDVGSGNLDKINWYFYDGMANEVSLGDFSAYAVLTFDTVFSPILAVYTVPTGSGDAASWYKSRVVYSSLGVTPELGKRYLVYFGEDPLIHPEFPRIQLGVSSGSTVGPQEAGERVLTVSLGTNSNVTTDSIEMLAQHLGVYSPEFKADLELKIQAASKTSIDEFINNLDTTINNLVPQYHTMKVVLDAGGLISIDLDHIIIPKSINVAVSRAAVHLDEDFEITEEGGVSRLTWIGSLQVGGAEAVEEGDSVFISYSYLAG